MHIARAVIIAAGGALLAVALVLVLRPLYLDTTPCGTLLAPHHFAAFDLNNADPREAACQQYRLQQLPWVAIVAIAGVALLAAGLLPRRNVSR